MKLATRRLPILGDAPDFVRDPLSFLTRCAATNSRFVDLKLPFTRAVLLLDARDIEQVLATGNDAFVKPPWLRTPAVRRLLGDGLVTADGNKWREQRRVSQPAFHGRQMARYAAVIDAVAQRAVSSWTPGQKIDILHAMTAITMEIVGVALLGDGMLAERDAISEIMDLLMTGFGSPWKLFGFAPLPSSAKEKRAGERLDRLIDGIVRRAALEQAEPDTLLAMLIDANGGCGGSALREQVKTFISAGHESSALCLTWVLACLSRHLEADRRVGREVRDSGDDPLSSGELPYLQAVIKETLRLYPPLWMTGRQASRDITVGGKAIRRGTLLLTSQWAVQRSVRYFESPDRFAPDRWIDIVDLPKFAYFPFGGGPRGCIGQRFALLEIGIVAAAFLRRFGVEIEPGADFAPWATMTLRPPVGLMGTLHDRF